MQINSHARPCHVLFLANNGPAGGGTVGFPSEHGSLGCGLTRAGIVTDTSNSGDTFIAGRTILRNKLPDTVMELEHTILEGSGSLWNGLLYTLRVADIRVQHTQITSS